jgi:protein SCO1/2
MQTRFLQAGVGVLVGLVVVLLGWQFFDKPYTFRGSLIDPPAPAFDFSLSDQDGRAFRLSEQRGRVVLVFFGYTHSPDVCPVTLTEFQRVRQSLDELAEQVRFVFISVDPERDSPQVLKAHLANYDPAIIGLTGSRAELEPVWEKYGVYQAKREAGSAAGYLVDHTSRTYLIDPNGNWRLTYPFEMDPQAIVDDVTHLLQAEAGK